MILSKIDRYILKNTIRLAVFYTILPTLILWLVQSRKIFELALGGTTSTWLIFKLSLYLIPSILPHIIPFAALLAVITIIVRLYNDSELCIFWASGISPNRMMRSFLIFGALNIILILIINIFIAAQVSRQLKIELLTVKNDLIRSALKPGLIQTPQKNMMIYIDNIKANSYIEGFYLQHIMDNNQIRIFTAKEAILKEDKNDFELLLLGGRILQWDSKDIDHSKAQNKNNKDPKDFPIVLEFDKFTLNISDILAKLSDSQDLHFKARDYSISDLLSAKNAQSEQEKMRFIARGHEQITASLLPFIFILFAVLIMLYPIPPRGFPYRLIFQTILLTVLFRIFNAMIHNASHTNLYFIEIAYAVHFITIIAIIAFIMIKRRSMI
ncbi:MAG: lipopolysaccharide export system permease protein [Alphaproteobacteria bacterium]|jgi:lipopolysaccharide export system permease protein